MKKKYNMIHANITVLFFLFLIIMTFQSCNGDNTDNRNISNQNKSEKMKSSSKPELMPEEKNEDPEAFEEDEIVEFNEDEDIPLKFVTLSVILKGAEREKYREVDLNIEFYSQDRMEKIHDMNVTLSNYKVNSLLVPKGAYYVTMDYEDNFEWEKITTDRKGEKWGCKYMIDFSLFYEGELLFLEKHVMVINLKIDSEYKNYIPGSGNRVPYEISRKWVLSDVSVLPLK